MCARIIQLIATAADAVRVGRVPNSERRALRWSRGLAQVSLHMFLFPGVTFIALLLFVQDEQHVAVSARGGLYAVHRDSNDAVRRPAAAARRWAPFALLQVISL